MIFMTASSNHTLYFHFFQVASSIVLRTFMSAPIMYISARLVLITKASDAQYENVIQNTRRDVTIVALIGLVSKFPSLHHGCIIAL